jgi:hypothetical protein
MSISPEVLDAMLAAGCTAEQIVAAVKADAAVGETRRATKRENNAERQRRFRQRNARNALRDVTERDAPPPDKERSPTPPKEINLPPIFEKEREREIDLDGEDFRKWFSAWPTSLTDDETAAHDEWGKLSPEERSAIQIETPKFIDGVKASKRTMWPSAAKFLAGRMWERLQGKPPPSVALPRGETARNAIERAFANDHTRTSPNIDAITSVGKFKSREEWLAAEKRRSDRSFR